jgi:hypothetical protein
VIAPKRAVAGGSDAGREDRLRAWFAARGRSRRPKADRSDLRRLHENESKGDVRFKTVVGRSQTKTRFCPHDRATLPAIRGTNRPGKKHGPLLCDVDRAGPLWPSLSDTSVGPYRFKGSHHDPSLRARTGCGSPLPRPHPPETEARISNPIERQALITAQDRISTSGLQFSCVSLSPLALIGSAPLQSGKP